MNNLPFTIKPLVTEEIELDSDTHARLTQMAIEKNRTVDELIREILEFKLAEVVQITQTNEVLRIIVDKKYAIVVDGVKPIALIKPIGEECDNTGE